MNGLSGAKFNNKETEIVSIQIQVQICCLFTYVVLVPLLRACKRTKVFLRL